MKQSLVTALFVMFCGLGMAQIPVDGLIAHYPFNGNALDASPNMNNGTVYGATLTTDRFGYPSSAYYLNGSSNYISVANSPSLNPANSISICAWFKPDYYTGGGNSSIIDKAYTSHTAPYYQYKLGATGDYKTTARYQFLGWVATSGTNHAIATGNNYWSTGTWYFLVCTYDGVNLKFYINNQLFQSIALTGSLGQYNTPLMIGNNSNVNNFVKGVVDDIRIYDRALTAAEIDTLFNETPCAAPLPVATTVTRCGSGSVMLTASGGTDYKWYDSPSGGSVLGTAATFTTPYLVSTDTFYVTNTVDCESPRVMVQAKVLSPKLSGTVLYANATNTPMVNTKIYLRTLQGVKVDSVFSDIFGHYSFCGLPPGDYVLTAKTTSAAGGMNATDALLALKSFSEESVLSGMPLLAADANRNGYVNATDAFLIHKRFSGLMTHFSEGDWVFGQATVHVSFNASAVMNIIGICTGDVNASYQPE